VAASPTAAVQAWGFDAKGRKQYRYHERAAERGQLRKFHRVRQMARDLPSIRATVAKDLRAPGLTRRRVAAGVVRLINEAYFRVGSDRYADENKTFGASTLLKRHVQDHGDRVVFDFVGKESVRQHQIVVDPQVLAFVRSCSGRRAAGSSATGRPRRLGEPLVAGRQRVPARPARRPVLGQGLPHLGRDAGHGHHPQRHRPRRHPARDAEEPRHGHPPRGRGAGQHAHRVPQGVRAPHRRRALPDEGSTIAPFLTRAAVRRATARAATTGRGHEGHPPEERALIGFLDKYFPERRSGRKRDRRRGARDAAGDRRRRAPWP
jgi:DNA topoisomerase-1